MPVNKIASITDENEVEFTLYQYIGSYSCHFIDRVIEKGTARLSLNVLLSKKESAIWLGPLREITIQPQISETEDGESIVIKVSSMGDDFDLIIKKAIFDAELIAEAIQSPDLYRLVLKTH